MRLIEEYIEQMEDKLEDQTGQASEGFKTITRILMATGDENLVVEKACLLIDDEKFNCFEDLWF